VPKLVTWDAWGTRIDHIELTPLWKRAARIAAEEGLIATAYERAHGPLSRVTRWPRFTFCESTAVYTCPLAMTDGAAKTLAQAGNAAVLERALPHLTSRDPARMWTSGQWMTERTGGSDVAISETVARFDGEGHRLYGTKWFTSATTRRWPSRSRAPRATRLAAAASRCSTSRRATNAGASTRESS